MRSYSRSPPEHWEDVAKVGGLLAAGRFGHLVCARVPLDASYTVDRDESWTPLELLDTCYDQGLSVHMVIDLTNTYKYYSGASELETRNVEYVKMRVEGFADVPSEDVVDRFIDVVSRWEASLAPDDDLTPVAVVHCTHGLNRTGYLVVRYLMATQGLSVKDALRTFAAARPPGLIKHMYVQKLFEMFDQVDELELPVLPSWAMTKYDRSQDQLASADVFKATEDDRDLHEKVVQNMETRRNDDRRSPPQLRRMPENWRNAPKIGTRIANTNLVAMRTLLSDDYSVPPSETWTPKVFVATTAAAGLNVQLVIDLTNTTKYYDAIPGIRREKLVCEGFRAAPTATIIDAFIALVTTFDDAASSSSSPGGHIAVHCTHGLNRTGYLVIHYLVRVKGLSLVDALAAFADARPPGLLKPSYIEALFETYAPNDVVTYPTSLPAWALAKYSKDSRSRKTSKSKKTKNAHVTKVEAMHARKPPPMQWLHVPNAGAPITSRSHVTFLPLKTMLDARYEIALDDDWTPRAFEAWNATHGHLDAIISMDGPGYFYDHALLSVPVFHVRLLSKSSPNPPLIASFYDAIAAIQAQKETTSVRIGLQCGTMSRAAFFLLHHLMTQDKLSLHDAMAIYTDAYPPGPLLRSLLRDLRKLDGDDARPAPKKVVFESDESDVDEPFGSHVETHQPSS